MQIMPFERRSSQKTQCHCDWYMFRLYPAGPSTSAMVHNKSSTGTNKDSRTAASHILRQKITGQQKSKKQPSSMLSFRPNQTCFWRSSSEPLKKTLTFHLYWLFKKKSLCITVYYNPLIIPYIILNCHVVFVIAQVQQNSIASHLWICQSWTICSSLGPKALLSTGCATTVMCLWLLHSQNGKKFQDSKRVF